MTVDAEQLGEVFHIDAEAVRRHLEALEEAGYAVHHQDDADSSLALLDAMHRDEHLEVFGARE